MCVEIKGTLGVPRCVEGEPREVLWNRSGVICSGSFPAVLLEQNGYCLFFK